jgi:hypothetical protein
MHVNTTYVLDFTLTSLYSIQQVLFAHELFSLSPRLTERKSEGGRLGSFSRTEGTQTDTGEATPPVLPPTTFF